MNRLKQASHILVEAKKTLKGLLVKREGRNWDENHDWYQKFSKVICRSLMLDSADPSIILNGILNLFLESYDNIWCTLI